MKKFLSVLLSLSLAVGSFSVNVFAEESDYVDAKAEAGQKVVEDAVSRAVVQKGLFEEEKVQEFDSFKEGADAVQEVINENEEIVSESEEDEMSVDNCVIVRTGQDISFDTSNVITAVRYDGIYYIQYETVQDAQDAIEVFQTYPTVEYAVADCMITLDDEVIEIADASTSQDTNGYQHLSWGVTDMYADVFADYVARKTSRSVTVAVVDTGVYSSHPFLQGRVLNNGYDFVNNDADPADDSKNGHGTHVAGTVVDCTQGLNVNILPVKVLNNTNYGSTITIANGIRYAMNSGADIINLSLGGPEDEQHQIHIDYVISQAVSNGIAVVASSGNDYVNTVGVCPAHRNDIIVTAAIDVNHNNMYYYNNEGEEKGSNYGSSVDLTAPGVSIKSCVPYSVSSTGYGILSGTSMAAPHISAAVAMLQLLYPTASVSQIENILKSYTQDLGSTGYDTTYGYGLPILTKLITNLPFYDVQLNDWYYDSVLGVYTRGYMTGRNTDYFGPAENMQRQDMTVLMYRMAGSPTVTYRSIYPDVPSNAYFANAAVWAYDSGIITGINGNLGVCYDICRQDFALILYRYAKWRGLNVSKLADISNYSDVASVGSYAYTAVRWAVGNGLMGQNASLNPVGSANRAEVATMINRFIKAYNL